MKKGFLTALVAGAVLASAGTAGSASAAVTTPADLVKATLADRSAALQDGNSVALDAHYLASASKLKAHEQQRVQKLRKQLQDTWPGKIISITSTPKVASTDVTGNSATVKAYDEMEIVWIPTQDAYTETIVAKGPNGEITSKFGTWHDVALANVGGKWLITSDSYDEGPGLTKSPDFVAPKSSTLDSYEPQALTPGTQPQTLYTWTYNHQAAANYADAYWSSYNGSYKNFNPVGGDCANFVSQSLRAGGQPDDGSWYYRNAGGSTADDAWTYAWVNNQGLRDWARNTSRGITYSDYSQLMVGDIVNYDWDWNGTYDHVTIVVQAGANALIDSHNNDRYHVPYNYSSSQGMSFTHLYTWP
ncbi:amidase domain-containing protein [Tumebacillus permanentifrigoris]|uniref:Putative amidase-like protein n=1 Tax=Tumebacillus permanentifrigoris TaxID=378543 RepID=A0A316DVL4_9BACL|nr:amidase domain-containing protein [Tumebacillus permanentifrigoris]PWK13385.1 putative amidase-like protein [Tumebacillus permanentifrigoris]